MKSTAEQLVSSTPLSSVIEPGLNQLLLPAELLLTVHEYDPYSRWICVIDDPEQVLRIVLVVASRLETTCIGNETAIVESSTHRYCEVIAPCSSVLLCQEKEVVPTFVHSFIVRLSAG